MIPVIVDTEELAREQVTDEELQQELRSPSSLELRKFFYLKPTLVSTATVLKTISIHSFQCLYDDVFSTWCMDCHTQAEELPGTSHKNSFGLV